MRLEYLSVCKLSQKVNEHRAIVLYDHVMATATHDHTTSREQPRKRRCTYFYHKMKIKSIKMLLQGDTVKRTLLLIYWRWNK
jgi:hypothetical protein